MSKKDNIKTQITRLKQGLSTGNRVMTAEASVCLSELGNLSVRALETELRKTDLNLIINSGAVSIISGLLVTLRDLDEVAADRFSDYALSQSPPQLLRSAISLIQSFSRKNFRETICNDILIFEANGLDTRYNATVYLKDWLSIVPAQDLMGISRIYIIKENADFDYSGQYAPKFACITLVWDESFHPLNPLNWFGRFRNQKTLYHEIGHHKHRHTYGQIEEQEKQANQYSREQLHVAFPKLRFVVRIIYKLFGIKPTAKRYYVILLCSENVQNFYISIDIIAHSEKDAIEQSIIHMKVVEGVNDVEFDEIEELEFENEMSLKPGILQVMGRSYFQ